MLITTNHFLYIYVKVNGEFMICACKNIFLGISAVILTLCTITSANTCTETYFNAQAHTTFDQKSNLRIDSIFYSQSPAGRKGKKFFYNNSFIEKVIVDFKRNEVSPAYWFIYRDTNETVLSKKGFYEYIDSTYKKQNTFPRLATSTFWAATNSASNRTITVYKLKYISYKILFHVLLRLPDLFYTILFAVFFPIYKALHKKRAYGRIEQHLELAREYVVKKTIEKNTNSPNNTPLLHTSAKDVFRGIFWNALDSYRGLARLKSTVARIDYENEHIIRDAIAKCAVENAPIAAISIHQGAFELLHRSLCRYSEHVHLITDSVGDTAFRDVLKELRSDPHLTEYHPNETGRLIRELFRTKGILAMVVDQGRHTKGNTVSLFGRPSTLYLRLPKKVNDMGAGIVIFRTWSEPNRIVIRFEKYYPPKYDSFINCNTQAPLVTDIAREIENWIADHPSEWSWNYHGNFTAD